MSNMIRISETVHKRLKNLKKEGDHSSFDSVVRSLLKDKQKLELLERFITLSSPYPKQFPLHIQGEISEKDSV